jgi:hypothetical protein
MRILIVNKPLQTKTSSDLEYVEYREEHNEINGFLDSIDKIYNKIKYDE